MRIIISTSSIAQTYSIHANEPQHFYVEENYCTKHIFSVGAFRRKRKTAFFEVSLHELQLEIKEDTSISFNIKVTNGIDRHFIRILIENCSSKFTIKNNFYSLIIFGYRNFIDHEKSEKIIPTTLCKITRSFFTNNGSFSI